MNKTQPETIADIAVMAGVSATTVSRVINNSGYVGKKTRENIEEILRATGFIPNMAAKTLVTSSTKMVGLLLPTFNNPIYLELLKGVNEAAAAHGYSVVIGQRVDEKKSFKESLMRLASLNVDGIISTIPDYHAIPHEEYLLPFFRKTFPLAQLGIGVKEFDIDGVSIASYESGYQIGRHLASLGHEKLAIIGHRGLPFILERIKGLKSAYIESGLGIKGIRFFDAVMSKSGGYEVASRIFEEKVDISAIFAVNDIMAIGVYLAAEENEKIIPDDVAIIGVGGIDTGLIVRPRLSTFILPTYDMGRELFSLLYSRMAGSYRGESRTIEFHGRLAVRESTLVSQNKM